jgi:hypothetical protein
VREQLHALRKYTYGKHVVSRVEKLLSAGTKIQTHLRSRPLPDDSVPLAGSVAAARPSGGSSAAGSGPVSGEILGPHAVRRPSPPPSAAGAAAAGLQGREEGGEATAAATVTVIPRAPVVLSQSSSAASNSSVSTTSAPSSTASTFMGSMGAAVAEALTKGVFRGGAREAAGGKGARAVAEGLEEEEGEESISSAPYDGSRQTLDRESSPAAPATPDSITPSNSTT